MVKLQCAKCLHCNWVFLWPSRLHLQFKTLSPHRAHLPLWLLTPTSAAPLLQRLFLCPFSICLPILHPPAICMLQSNHNKMIHSIIIIRNMQGSQQICQLHYQTLPLLSAQILDRFPLQDIFSPRGSAVSLLLTFNPPAPSCCCLLNWTNFGLLK